MEMCIKMVSLQITNLRKNYVIVKRLAFCVIFDFDTSADFAIFQKRERLKYYQRTYAS